MKSLAPYFGMVLVQLAYGGSNILAKLALEQGLSYLVFIVYRHLIAMAILGPLAYVLERKQRQPLSFTILTKIFILALFGTTIHQNVYYAGLDYTSPTVASALSSVIPALTFSLAVLLRMEEVKIRDTKGRAKVLGALVCIGGALLFTFWKGHLLKGFAKQPLITGRGGGSGHGSRHCRNDWIKGSFLILTSYVAFSAWLILQAMVYEVYPARLTTNTWICFFASLQSCALALIFERSASSWKLDWNIQLLTIIYSGTVISCLAYYLQTFCISKRGPVFASMFCPLLLVIVGLFSAFLFAERLHLGSGIGRFYMVILKNRGATTSLLAPAPAAQSKVQGKLSTGAHAQVAQSLIGAIVIILGLYTVLWGKSKDSDEDSNDKRRIQWIQQKPSPQFSSSSTEGHHV